MTRHKLIISDSGMLTEISPGSIGLIVTSPPYPMIEMWDEVFIRQNKQIRKALTEAPDHAFRLMHGLLDKTWESCTECLKPGGIICINVGDATRTISNQFRLFPNHARIIDKMMSLGFSSLPGIIWRKTTNAPNKFMGSGMLAPGAYVTLEHEHILIFRKGNKREFNTSEARKNRNESAYFWEERNKWFSDLWELKGTTQILNETGIRKRSAAFPFEVPCRLINMFSVKEDHVLDPFAGTGTTSVAAVASGRNSIGIDIDNGFCSVFNNNIRNCKERVNRMITARLKDHEKFVRERIASKGRKSLKHTNRNYGFPVMTRQEADLTFERIDSINEISNNEFEVQYMELSGRDFRKGGFKQGISGNS